VRVRIVCRRRPHADPSPEREGNRTPAIIYQYDERMWAAEIVKRAGPGDERTLHFSSELILAVAKLLKVRQGRMVSEEQRRGAAERVRA